MVLRVSYKGIVTLITIQKSFCQAIRNIILIFSLVGTALLSNSENLILSFSPIKTVFLPSYKNIILIFSLIKTVFFPFFVLVYIK